VPNNLAINGGQAQKQTRFSSIFTSRFFSGLWTNRSPLRDATTSRAVEKYYGQNGDALIAGLNTEITSKLTLARRPGTSVFDGNSYTGVDRFYEFRLFNATTEQINVMVDQANALYSVYNSVKSLVLTKRPGAGQTYMQSVGNTLYFADGIDNKKWLQSLVVWSAGMTWNNTAFGAGTGATPFFTTFLIDANGNIQQLTGTEIALTEISVDTNNVLTVTSTSPISTLLAVGDIFTFPATMTATFLEGTSVEINTVSANSFTAIYYVDGSDFTHVSYSGSESVTAPQIAQGSPISGSTLPTWSTVVPSAANNFQGGITVDGSVIWTNRGTPVENWGIQPPTKAMTPNIGVSFSSSWAKNTFYSPAGVVIDSNGNLQQVTVPGTSSTNAPTWNATLYGTTTDGSVTWTMIQTAASMVWQPGYAYIPPSAVSSVAASSGGSAVYTGVFLGGAANALVGNSYLVTGFADSANNGIFSCTASTSTTLTLNNTRAIAQNGTSTALATQQHTIQYLIANAGGTSSLIRLMSMAAPSLTGNVSAYLFPNGGMNSGYFTEQFPTNVSGAAASDTTLNSLTFSSWPAGLNPSAIDWLVVNGAGPVIVGGLVEAVVPFPTYTKDYDLIIEASLEVPVAGTYTFTILHHSGMLWGIGGGATGTGSLVNTQGQVVTAANGFPIFGGTNIAGNYTDTFSVTFPASGVYPVEINYAMDSEPSTLPNPQGVTLPPPLSAPVGLEVECNGFALPNGPVVSGVTIPAFPSFSTAYAPNYATVTEASGTLVWATIGPVGDFFWSGGAGYTLPNTLIIDSQGYSEAPFRSGYTLTTTPFWSGSLYSLTLDNPNLIWINEGQTSALPTGSLSTFNGGWEYGIALVNTLDNTVSNCTPLSAATNNFNGVKYVTIAAGDGLPPPAAIDPQCDYVAIFRTTDGQTTPFLIPGVSTVYTISLHDYLLYGYSDTTPDVALNNLIEGAIEGQNTPPAQGATNLAYHLNRLFYSVGNVVYWTSGPQTPVGNGLNGTSPLNFDSTPSLVKRIVPTAAGAFIFTVSDVYVIQTSSGNIQSALPLLPGIGLLSYNALDVNGSLIGLFTTDSQFLIIDPSSGFSIAGFPIADQLRLNNGNPGQSWNAANVYVAWHVQGEDSGWYLCDGSNGWYKLITTPAPETGSTWSTFATITNGAKAVQSIEISPGVRRLLIGPTGTGTINQRDLTMFSDTGTPYSAYAVIGSCVLAQPGQIAEVAFLVTDAAKVGTPISLGFLADEALPYYTGPIEILKNWESDPPNLPTSKSLYSQRFYLADMKDMSATMRHCQIQVIFNPYDTVQNELLALTIFGAYSQEL
jgi:hypothetical protein